MERRLLADYEAVLDEIVAELSRQNHATAVALADYPRIIRGYGHIKDGNVKRAQAERMKLRAGLKNPQGMKVLEAAE